MISVLTVLGAVVVGALLVLGAVQVATGWAPRGVRDETPRPRLSGAATLVHGAGLAVFLFLGPLGSAVPGQPAIPLLGLAAGNIAGAGLRWLARRPPRAAVPPTAFS
ncbi:hypothetical protein [Streptomyces sp. NRRL B-3229]|uniref:hypothetical protein n=1 Tax=Streptomyces sp. NRRL B-3229 TaxID=1463836 RepID=UPI0004C20142|nr:hypothetical protein [Streptomyces sp. NRRL B-3229]